MGLRLYKSKRNFLETREPSGREKPSIRRKRQPVFVVQKHAARRLHYDFRLEVGGVLKSWAVPKGIPTVKGERRLAVQVEDHPRDYGSFEGVIPAGNYGAGTVMLWDRGTYEALDGTAKTSLQAGKLSLILRGKKLRGHWSLIKLRRNDGPQENAWLLIKTGETTSVSLRADKTSAKSGRTLPEIAKNAASKRKD